MDTTEIVLQLREHYRKTLCENQFDVPGNIDTYNPKDHKGIRCSYCDSLHVVHMTDWLAFLQLVGAAGLTQREKNEFIHAGVTSGTVRKNYVPEIEASPHWGSLTVLFEDQQAEITQFVSRVCDESAEHRKNNMNILLSTVKCDAHGKRHYMLSSTLAEFAKNIEYKTRLGKFSTTLPPLVYAHAETMLDSVAHTFMKNLDARSMIPNLPLIQHLINHVHTHEVDVLKDLDSFLPRLHVATWCVICTRVHVVAKTDWEWVKTQIAGKVNYRAPFFEQIKMMPVNAYCEQLAKNNPDYSDQLLELVVPNGKFLSSTYMEYILPAQYVPNDLFVEYYMCGRKNRYDSAEETLQAMQVHKSIGGSRPYVCPYCEGYHYGHEPQRTKTYEENVQKGIHAYVVDPKKANRFIHKLMFS